MDTIQLLKDHGVLDMKDGSVELFFDDVGKVQQIIYRVKKVKRDTPLVVREIKRGTAIAHFDGEGIMQKVIYETFWKRGKVDNNV